MQPHRPAIAVVTPSILTGLGLESILRRIIPMAEVEVYDRFERFAADRPDRFFHYFVASQTFVEHNAFFLERRHKSILLTDGAPQSTLRELHCLDIAQSEEGLVRDILRLHQHAHREGYPEIGLYWEKAAYEEAEHAAKFAEMLGEDLEPNMKATTKDNLKWRVDCEFGATQGKFDLAKCAKKNNLDAIHDTVHEMAKDEARHGRALKGLLERYFK